MFDTSTKQGRDMRQAQLDRENIDRLLKLYQKTGKLGIVNILMAKYGIEADVDISRDGNLNRA